MNAKERKKKQAELEVLRAKAEVLEAELKEPEVTGWEATSHANDPPEYLNGMKFSSPYVQIDADHGFTIYIDGPNQDLDNGELEHLTQLVKLVRLAPTMHQILTENNLINQLEGL